MENDLSNYRKSYEKGALLIENTPNNPMDLFNVWFKEIDHFFPDQENNAMSLVTIDLDGFPKSRIVLLKKYTSNGFVFFTNYKSDKGLAIAKNPKVCLAFFWPTAERQVIIKGTAEKISELESEDYFNTRPRGSQIGAVASKQSSIIPDRMVLEKAVKTLENSHKNKPVEKPKHWGGYLVKPIEFEFWQGRSNRLHDRICYKLTDDIFKKFRKSP